MHLVNIHQAKTNLSQLILRASQGEEIILCKAGKPLVKLTPYTPLSEPRKPGFWKGQIQISEDFDTLPASLMAKFSGEEG